MNRENGRYLGLGRIIKKLESYNKELLLDERARNIWYRIASYRTPEDSKVDLNRAMDTYKRVFLDKNHSDLANSYFLVDDPSNTKSINYLRQHTEDIVLSYLFYNTAQRTDEANETKKIKKIINILSGHHGYRKDGKEIDKDSQMTSILYITEALHRNFTYFPWGRESAKRETRRSLHLLIRSIENQSVKDALLKKFADFRAPKKDRPQILKKEVSEKKPLKILSKGTLSPPKLKSKVPEPNPYYDDSLKLFDGDSIIPKIDDVTKDKFANQASLIIGTFKRRVLKIDGEEVVITSDGKKHKFNKKLKSAATIVMMSGNKDRYAGRWFFDNKNHDHVNRLITSFDKVTSWVRKTDLGISSFLIGKTTDFSGINKSIAEALYKNYYGLSKDYKISNARMKKFLSKPAIVDTLFALRKIAVIEKTGKLLSNIQKRLKIDPQQPFLRWNNDLDIDNAYSAYLKIFDDHKKGYVDFVNYDIDTLMKQLAYFIIEGKLTENRRMFQKRSIKGKFDDGLVVRTPRYLLLNKDNLIKFEGMKVLIQPSETISTKGIKKGGSIEFSDTNKYGDNNLIVFFREAEIGKIPINIKAN